MEDAWARDLYPTEESSILFGTKKNLSKDRWCSPLPWMSWLNIMVPKTKKTLYLGVAIAIDPDSPRRIKSKNTFKRHGFFSPKISIPRAEVTSSATAASSSYRWRSRCGAPSCRWSHSTGCTAEVYWSLGTIKIWFGNHGEMYLIIGSMAIRLYVYLPTWILDVYGLHVGKYTSHSHGSYGYWNYIKKTHLLVLLPGFLRFHLLASWKMCQFGGRVYRTPRRAVCQSVI